MLDYRTLCKDIDTFQNKFPFRRLDEKNQADIISRSPEYKKQISVVMNEYNARHIKTVLIHYINFIKQNNDWFRENTSFV